MNNIMENQIGLPKDYAEKIVGKLNALLSNVQIFYINVRGFHWNITGKQFFLLHAKFEDLYNSLNDKADEIAERILMLESIPVHSFSKYLKLAKIQEKEGICTAEETVKEVLNSLKLLLKEEREIVSMASSAGDDGTVDLITGFIDEQEKMVWMYSAYSG
jgi:starvation-inducible DNA-binding protein